MTTAESDGPTNQGDAMRTDTFTNTPEDAAAFERAHNYDDGYREGPDAGDLADLAADAARTARENDAYETRRQAALAEGGWMPSIFDRDEAETLQGFLAHAHHWSAPDGPGQPLGHRIETRCTRDGIFGVAGLDPARFDEVIALIERRNAASAFAGISYEARVVDNIVWVKMTRPEPESTPPF